MIRRLSIFVTCAAFCLAAKAQESGARVARPKFLGSIVVERQVSPHQWVVHQKFDLSSSGGASPALKGAAFRTAIAVSSPPGTPVLEPVVLIRFVAECDGRGVASTLFGMGRSGEGWSGEFTCGWVRWRMTRQLPD